MTPFKSFSRRASQARVLAAVVSLSGVLWLTSCGQEYVTEEKVTLTKGLITEVEEVGPDEYKIINETAIDDTSASQVIAHQLSGKIDTFSMAEVRQAQQGRDTSANGASTGGSWDENSSGSGTSGTTHHYHHYPSHGLSNVLWHTMMGYYIGRAFSAPTSPGFYRDQSTYSRSASTTRQVLNQTAVRTTVRKPVSGSSGFGSGRSTRSFGG